MSVRCPACGEQYEPRAVGRWGHICLLEENLLLAAQPSVKDPEPWAGIDDQQCSIHCDGPVCQQTYAGTFYLPSGWRVLSNRAGEHHEFCSLRCIAEWLDGELGKAANYGT